jgi:hypothetical protein
MKLGIVHWLLVAAAFYEAGVGVAELTGNSAQISGTQLPSAGTLIGSVYDPVDTLQFMGGIDLAVAALLFVFPLHKQLRG